MLSLKELQEKQQYWGTIRWISSGVTIAAGVAALYFNSRINSLKKDYDNATSQEIINEKRSSTEKNKSLYRTFTGITFTGLTGFAVSWLIQVAL